MDHFWVMATTASGAIIIIVLVTFVIYETREYILERRRQRALGYLLDKTRDIYFYGTTVAECLECNMAWELQWRKVGDFFRQIGMLVLCALENSSYEAVMYSRLQELPDWHQDCYEAFVRFYYRDRWWDLDLSRGLGDCNLRPVRAGHKDFELCKTYEQTRFWKLERSKRIELERCHDSNKSCLEPETRYVIVETDDDYLKYVQSEIWIIMDWWHFHNERPSPQQPVEEEADVWDMC